MEFFFASKFSMNIYIYIDHISFRLINKLKPGAVSKIHTSGGPMKLRENISLFQNAARAYGVSESEVFQAVDLFDKQNIQQVTVCSLLISSFIFLIFNIVMHFCFESSCTKAKFQWTKIKLSNQITLL
jgi:hypothetical protein